MRWFRCLHYLDEEVFKASTSKTDQYVDVQANQSSYGSRYCVNFALTSLIFFFSLIMTILQPSQNFYIYIEPFL